MSEYTGVGVYITNNCGEVLLNLREDGPGVKWPGYWSIIGGRRDPGECDPRDTAVRELHEEVGLQVAPSALTPFHPSGPCPEPTNTLFHLRWDGAVEELLLGEGLDLRWVPFGDVAAMHVPGHVAAYVG